MRALENRIPPPIVYVLMAAAMWPASGLTPSLAMPLLLRAGLALLFFASAGIIAVAAFRKFGQAGTTIDPVNIDRASNLVTTGIYRVTRNPMYLSMTCLLLSEALAFGTASALAVPLAFVLFITRFQIMPEERVLEAKFGAPYAQYRARVRRWV